MKLSKEELVDYITTVLNHYEYHTENCSFRDYFLEEMKVKKLQKLLDSEYHNNKELREAYHKSDMEYKIRNQKKEIKNLHAKLKSLTN